MSQVKLSFDQQVEGDILILSFSGDLELTTLPDAKKKLKDLLGSHQKFVFNLEKLAYIDSSGLGFFIMALKRITEAGGKLALCSLNNYIWGIFNLINLNTVLDIYDDVETAKKAVA